MKPWIKRTLIGVFGASLVLGGLSACSRDDHHSRGPMSAEKIAEVRGKVMERVTDKLELNQAQQEKLGLLADKVEAQRKAFIGQTTDPRAEMQALISGEKFDRARAQTLLSEKTLALQSQSPEVLAAMADFYDSLNPEQQQKVRELTQRRKGWFKRG